MMDLALANGSYAFHEAMKVVARALVRARSRRSLGKPSTRTWTTLSDTLERAGSLPLVSVIGPRWNCHAAIATLGPLRVREAITCKVRELRDVAESWSIVVYDDSGRTVVWSGSANTQCDDVSWSLPPGTYGLIMRFYSERDEMVVPSVSVDGQDLRCGRMIPGEKSRYARNLQAVKNKEGLFYRGLHYYVFHHLRHATRTPEWTRAQFLPVGNPDTEWRYGHLSEGERLQVSFDDPQLACMNTYVSFYNWSSFPVHWCKIDAALWTSPVFEQPVAYAIRRVRTRRVSDGERAAACVRFDVTTV